jgi:hypothetical protein
MMYWIIYIMKTPPSRTIHILRRTMSGIKCEKWGFHDVCVWKTVFKLYNMERESPECYNSAANQWIWSPKKILWVKITVKSSNILLNSALFDLLQSELHSWKYFSVNCDKIFTYSITSWVADQRWSAQNQKLRMW